MIVASTVTASSPPSVAHALLIMCVVIPAVIEKFTENTRFCLICNYLSKIIPALQSRCTRFRFGPLTSDQMASRLEYVIQQERYVAMTIVNVRGDS